MSSAALRRVLVQDVGAVRQNERRIHRAGPAGLLDIPVRMINLRVVCIWISNVVVSSRLPVFACPAFSASLPFHVPVQRVCRVFGMARSTAYYLKAREAVPPDQRPVPRKRGPVYP